nr:amidohydrolase family protein [Lachnoclostridium phocaeense]
MIDMHTHLWPTGQSPGYMKDYLDKKKKEGINLPLTGPDLLESMDHCGIRQAVISVLAFDSHMENQDLLPLHDYVEKQIAASNGRLAAFCTVQPFRDDTLETLTVLLSRHCFCGLKLHPNIQCFYPDDKRLYPLYRWMESNHFPVLFHTGGIGLKGVRDDYGSPEHIDPIACDFPNLPIIMGHAGRIHYETTAMLLRKHRHVYADISTNFGRLAGEEWRQLLHLMETVKLWCGTTEKLLPGSDSPFYPQDATVAFIQKLQEHIAVSDILAEADTARLLECNAEDFCRKYGIFQDPQP